MNAFVEMCITAVASGRITIHQVPLQYREAVKAAITDTDDDVR